MKHIIGINTLTSNKPCESLCFKGGFRFPNELSRIERNKRIKVNEKGLKKELIENKSDEVKDQILTL